MPLLSLAAAVTRSGSPTLAAELLRRALPPRGLGLEALGELRPWNVAAMKMLLPLAQAQGEEGSRGAGVGG